MSYYIKKEIGCFVEYVEFIKEYKKKNSSELWYRGQRNDSWNLEPSIFRDKQRIEGDGKIQTLKYSNIPDFIKELNRYKKGLHKNIKEEFNLFHIMFLGQHYKLLTPALDWSTDPLIALFFALDKYEENKSISPLIFILKPNLLNKYTGINFSNGDWITGSLLIDNLNDQTLNDWYRDLNNTPFDMVPVAVRSDKYISHRMSRQSGAFTLHGARHPLNYSWIGTSIEGEAFGEVILIKPEAVEEIREYLETLNVTNETIYGNEKSDLDSLGEEISKNMKRI